jgi:mono/diheme cytochrome c family protein
MSRPVRRWHGGATRFVTPLLAATAVATGSAAARAQEQAPPAAPAEAGKRLFETVCVACHTIGGGVRIGPDLAGVTARRDHDWLVRFITDPEQLRQSGDSVAAANLARYGVRMPDLGLSAAQVEAVVTHLGATAPAPPERPALYLPTIALSLLAAAGITLVALTSATRRSETRA